MIRSHEKKYIFDDNVLLDFAALKLFVISNKCLTNSRPKKSEVSQLKALIAAALTASYFTVAAQSDSESLTVMSTLLQLFLI